MTKCQRPGSQPGRGDNGDWSMKRPFITVKPRSPQDPEHLNEPLRRLAWLKRELERWDAEGGSWPMPQPKSFGLALPDLKPSEIAWPAPRTESPQPETGRGGRP